MKNRTSDFDHVFATKPQQWVKMKRKTIAQIF
jgi:hypothetical protein